MYSVIRDHSIKSNNFYNYANYVVRQKFIKESEFLNYQCLQKELRAHDLYKDLMSQSSQCQLRLLEKNWKSYFRGIKEWKKNPSKFLGMPKIPKYKKKGGCHIWLLKNNQTYIKDGYLGFKLKCMNGYKFKTNVTGRLISVRFVPRNDIFVMEIVYEEEVNTEFEDNGRVASIDLGVNNFITMVNNIQENPVVIKSGIIKSINQYYNKQRAYYQSRLQKDAYWSNNLSIFTMKRFSRVKNYIHHCSKYVVNYCIENNVRALVIGKNDTWKQNLKLGKPNTQNFINIPFDMLVLQLEYKCRDNGIKLVQTEESYTSGTSFLDNELPIQENYNKKRRIKRGLFKINEGSLFEFHKLVEPYDEQIRR